MANTKKLSRVKRKQVKRTMRRKTKDTWSGLTRQQRRQFKKGDEKSLKKFLASLKPKEEPKPEAPAAAEGGEAKSS